MNAMLEQLDWEEIKKAALLGTDRRPLSSSLIEQAKALGIDTEAPPEKVLSALILAGNVLLKTARTLPRQIPEEVSHQKEELLTPCPAYIANLLPKILKKEWNEILSEFIEVIHNRAWKFPTQSLPALLDRAAMEPAFWQKIKPLVTEQASWLIQQNPKWKDLQLSTDNTDLSFSPLVFETERTVDIEAANTHLFQYWPKLKKVKKLQYLIVLEKNVQLDDEVFLANTWGEKNAAVKIKMFDLLLNIRHSEISVIRSRYFSKLLNKKKNINLPELSDTEKTELKIIARHPDFKGGLKANFLTQILAGTNWSTWTKELKLTEKKFATWIEKQEWAAQILQALSHIVARENNHELRLILFKYYHHNSESIPDNFSLLLKGMSIEQFGELCSWSFEQGISILNEEGIFVKMALSFELAWPNKATFGFFKMIKLWLRKNPRYWEGWYIWQIIRRLSFQADPRELPLMERAFQQDMIWSLAEDEIKKFVSILKFRQQLYID